MNGILFLLVNSLLLAACHRLVLRFCTGEMRSAEKLLRISVLYMFCILCITYLLGFVLGCYSVWGITVCVLLLFGISLLVSRGVHPIADLRQSAAGCKRGMRALFCAMHRAEKAAVLALLCTLLCKLVCGGLLLAYDFDGLKYHLPNLVDYIQEQRFHLTEGIVWSNAYPKNFEMLNMWMLVFFRDGSFLRLPQFAAGLLGGIAADRIFCQIGFQRKHAFVGMLAVLSTPILLAQMNTAYIDAALCMLLFVAIAFLLDILEKPCGTDLLFFGMAVGMLIGMKYTGVAYAAVLMLWLLLALCKKVGFG